MLKHRDSKIVYFTKLLNKHKCYHKILDTLSPNNFEKMYLPRILQGVVKLPK